jgi:PPOX class probable F420-dependent enzyme
MRPSVSERNRIAMTGPEASDFLVAHRKMQLATIGKDGAPHLVTMFYTVLEGQIAFWTYRASQKARNMLRDPRVTCLIESGEDYFELQGVQVHGRVTIIEDPAEILRIGTRISADLTGVPGEGLADFVAHTARKRLGYIVRPSRISSWDHRKLLT